MKKLVTVFALCAAFSAYAQVESANIVGYNTKSIAAGKIESVGAQFQTVGAALNDRSLLIAAIPFPAPTKAGTSLGVNTDQVHVWNPAASVWVKYYNNTTNGWCLQGEVITTTNMLNVGEGFFVRRASSAAGSATYAGQVFNGTNVTYTLAAGKIQTISYPWPIGFNIAAIPAPTPLKAGTSLGVNTDQIHVWNTATSVWVKYYNNTTNGWCLSGEVIPTTDSIATGQTMVLRRASSAAGTLTLAAPVGL